jgi:hypothetical protein
MIHDVDAYADHALPGQRSELAFGNSRGHQCDPFEASAGASDGVEHAAVIRTVGTGANQQSVRHSVSVEHRAELRRSAGLTGMRLVAGTGRIRKCAAANTWAWQSAA